MQRVQLTHSSAGSRPSFLVYAMFWVFLAGLAGALPWATPAEAGAASAPAPAITPLQIPEKNIVTSARDGKFILLLDFNPFRQLLQSKPENEAKSIVTGTAKHYAELYGKKKEFASYGEVLVMVVYVKNMDEYNRPNYAGMTRHGTLLFRRAADKTFALAEDKVTLKPGA
jgi:hypothetical protein